MFLYPAGNKGQQQESRAPARAAEDKLVHATSAAEKGGPSSSTDLPAHPEAVDESSNAGLSIVVGNTSELAIPQE